MIKGFRNIIMSKGFNRLIVASEVVSVIVGVWAVWAVIAYFVG